MKTGGPTAGRLKTMHNNISTGFEGTVIQVLDTLSIAWKFQERNMHFSLECILVVLDFVVLGSNSSC